MRKNLLYVGILLFLFGLAAGFLSTQFAIPSQSGTPTTKLLLLNSGATGYVPIVMSQAGAAIFYFNSSLPVDFYLANASAFGVLSAGQVAGGMMRNQSLVLEGHGVYEIYLNSLEGVFPSGYSGIALPYFVQNASLLFTSGTYYAIFANSGTGIANITTRTLTVPLSSLNSEAQSILVYSGITLLLVIAGIVVIIISFFLKPKQEQAQKQAEMDEEAKKAYERIEKHRKPQGKR